jgi:Mg-chelatase subunit ChlD
LLVVDTSGSMRRRTASPSSTAPSPPRTRCSKTPLLASDDLIGIIGFDARAHEVWPLSPLLDRQDAHRALERLHAFGGAPASRGLQSARDQLSRLQNLSARRVVVLTDGQTR